MSAESERAAWLEWRRQGIGSSDAAAIAGLDPFKGPMAIWLEKTGRLEGREEPEAEHMRWGRLLESAIVAEFMERTGLYVAGRQSRVSHSDWPWMRATLDGLVCENPAPMTPEPLAPLGVLELKTVAGFKSEAWAQSEENPTGVPDHFRVQVLHQMIASGLEHAWVAVLFGGQRLEIRELEYDAEDAAALVELEAAFWERVRQDERPGGDGTTGSTEALRAAYPDSSGETVGLGPEAAELIAERRAAAADLVLAEKRKAAAEQGLMAMLGTAEAGVLDGRVRVTWKTQRRAGYTVEPAEYRVLRVVGHDADGD